MRKMKQQFTDSAKELKNLNTLIVTALLIALGVVLGEFSVRITPDIKIGVSFIATQLAATLFGPVVGCIMGGAGDVIKFILKPTGDFSILWTISAMVGPTIYGMMLYKKKLTFWRILLSKAVVGIVVNVVLFCTWRAIYSGVLTAYALVPTKLIQQAIQVPLQSVIFYVFVKALKKTKVFPQLS